MSGSVARLAEPLPEGVVTTRTGMGAAELASVEQTVRGLYHWTPSLSADGLSPAAGLAAVDVHWPEQGVSGVLFHTAKGGFIIHDLPMRAGAREVNAYLSHVVEASPVAGGLETLAERSVGDPSEDFCNVARSRPGQSQLPVQSERTVGALDIADRLGLDESAVLRAVDDLRSPQERPGCFAHARKLTVGGNLEVTGQPVERILA